MATAATREDLEREVRDAIAFHLQGLQEAGEPIRAVTDVAKSDLAAAGYAVDYVEARRADTLAPFGMESAPVGATGRVLVAARLGKTRLIDNMGFQRK